jgi:hypothetical protein
MTTKEIWGLTKIAFNAWSEGGVARSVGVVGSAGMPVSVEFNGPAPVQGGECPQIARDRHMRGRKGP